MFWLEDIFITGMNKWKLTNENYSKKSYSFFCTKSLIRKIVIIWTFAKQGVLFFCRKINAESVLNNKDFFTQFFAHWFEETKHIWLTKCSPLDLIRRKTDHFIFLYLSSNINSIIFLVFFCWNFGSIRMITENNMIGVIFQQNCREMMRKILLVQHLFDTYVTESLTK